MAQHLLEELLAEHDLLVQYKIVIRQVMLQETIMLAVWQEVVAQ